MVSPAPVLPFIPELVRVLLLNDAEFSMVTAGRLFTGMAPNDVSTPFATIQATANPIEPSAGVWSPMVQLDGWCAKGGFDGEEPQYVAWNIAAVGAKVLSRVKNVGYGDTYYTARLVDGPTPGVDTSRGKDQPLYRAVIRAELKLHAR